MALLDVLDVTKSFGGVVAVNGVGFSVYEEQIKAIIGPNGAGKTTLFNLLSGVERPTAGRIVFAGRDITGMRAHRVCGLGVGRTFQNTKLFEHMPVLDNVKVGRHARSRSGMVSTAVRMPRMRREEAEIDERAREIVRMVGLENRMYELAGGLPHGPRQLLEIGRALATEPQLLLLDEPAAGLNDLETGVLGQTIRRIRDRGITILLVEHDMRLVMNISDEVVVLNYGAKIAEGPPLLVQQDDEVIRAYLGRPIDDA